MNCRAVELLDRKTEQGVNEGLWPEILKVIDRFAHTDQPDR